MDGIGTTETRCHLPPSGVAAPLLWHCATGLAPPAVELHRHLLWPQSGPLVLADDCTDVLRGTIGVIQARLQAGEYTDRMSLMTLNASQ